MVVSCHYLFNTLSQNESGEPQIHLTVSKSMYAYTCWNLHSFIEVDVARIGQVAHPPHQFPREYFQIHHPMML